MPTRVWFNGFDSIPTKRRILEDFLEESSVKEENLKDVKTAFIGSSDLQEGGGVKIGSDWKYQDHYQNIIKQLIASLHEGAWVTFTLDCYDTDHASHYHPEQEGKILCKCKEKNVFRYSIEVAIKSSGETTVTDKVFEDVFKKGEGTEEEEIYVYATGTEFLRKAYDIGENGEVVEGSGKPFPIGIK